MAGVSIGCSKAECCIVCVSDQDERNTLHHRALPQKSDTRSCIKKFLNQNIYSNSCPALSSITTIHRCTFIRSIP
ncbi:hypothetical protein EYC84_003665 [Monilinia fructicola]|uniref:Uncharacterized protein n=1 Tax=Monilinia fructicola TaxID=38448 RepID=A0A5M9JWY2_MONFR|nr:hypothetical protein EYC84_003665 [Monilinia fructicola]